jgi:monoamine oxidase
MARKRKTKEHPRVVVAGAGLAGLTAARQLEALGAEIIIVEARDRVGGRVHTLRHGFAEGQHAEAGADLIEEEQEAVLQLAKELNLEPVKILRGGWGFYGTSKSGARKVRRAVDTFERAAARLRPEIAAYKGAESRWDSAVAQLLARESVASWIERARVDRELAAGVRGLRGFFLADADDLSLLPLVEQFASGDMPGAGRMYRLRNGNDGLPAGIAQALRGCILLNTVVRRVSQTSTGVRVAIDDGRLHEVRADYAIVAMPASTAKDVRFSPALADAQRRAIATLRYGNATRIVLQFERRFWKRLGRPIAYGSDRPTGAVWDGNEQQSRKPGILSLLAGGDASREVRRIVATGGWNGLIRHLTWLGRPSRLLAAASYTWERDRWAKGGYAVFDPEFDPALRSWLARPHGRVVFAGEHTSMKWQGYMNGAVESGRRAAIEVAAMAGLEIRPA